MKSTQALWAIVLVGLAAVGFVYYKYSQTGNSDCGFIDTLVGNC